MEVASKATSAMEFHAQEWLAISVPVLVRAGPAAGRGFSPNGNLARLTPSVEKLLPGALP